MAQLRDHSTSSSGSWLAQHMGAVATALAGVGAAANFLAAGCLLAASRRARRAGGSSWEPLLGGEAGRRRKYSSKQWRLVYGVAHYVWPDSIALQLR